MDRNIATILRSAYTPPSIGAVSRPEIARQYIILCKRRHPQTERFAATIAALLASCPVGMAAEFQHSRIL